MTAARARTFAGAIVMLSVAVAMLPFLQGCRSNERAPAGELHIGTLPLPSDPDDELINWAELVLAGRCMREQGYVFVVDWVVDRSNPEFWETSNGVDDVQLARTFGYGIGPSRRTARGGRGSDSTQAYLASLPAERQQSFTRAYFGDDADRIKVPSGRGSTISTNRGGCLSVARHELYGDLDRWVALDVRMSNLDADLTRRVLAAQPYRDALATWRSCMAGLGHPADDPQRSRQAVALTYQRQPYEQAWSAEQAWAVADATCTGRAGLRVVAEQQRQALERQPEFATADVQDYRARKTHAAHRAHTLLTELTR